MVTGLTDMVIMVTDIMATMARDLPMKEPLLNLAPTPMPKPTPGMVTMGMVTGLTGMVTMGTGHMVMAIMARDLLMKEPLLNLAPTPMPKPTPGTVTMGMVDTEVITGLTVMVTTGTDLTGDKKWTSRTTSDLSLPTHL